MRGLHFNMIWPMHAQPVDTEVIEHLREDLYALAVENYGGSFSAEHGVGRHNLAYYLKYTSAPALKIAGRIQEALDPRFVGATAPFGAPSKEIFHI